MSETQPENRELGEFLRELDTDTPISDFIKGRGQCWCDALPCHCKTKQPLRIQKLWMRSESFLSDYLYPLPRLNASTTYTVSPSTKYSNLMSPTLNLYIVLFSPFSFLIDTPDLGVNGFSPSFFKLSTHLLLSTSFNLSRNFTTSGWRETKNIQSPLELVYSSKETNLSLSLTTFSHFSSM